MIIHALTSPFDIGAALTTLGVDTASLPLEDVKVLCTPSGGAFAVTLPPTTFGASVQNMKITIASVDGVAGGTITVSGSAVDGLDGATQGLINGTSTKAVSNAGGYASAEFQIATPTLWVANTHS